jgi:hypothetical protein
MALTPLQRTICRLIARHRISSGESYVAGGAALNELTFADRLSHDIDLFHDTETALEATWNADRELLTTAGLEIQVLRERPGLVEAEVSNGSDRVRVEWARDSSFRFYPLVEHEDFGLTLHPFDLATNKVLALVGRLEVRDWIDVITSHDRIQPLGYLAWAACGKDPGFSPVAILEHAARTARYSAEEVGQLAFAGKPPDSAALSRRWHEMLSGAQRVIALLPEEAVGSAVLTRSGELCRAGVDDLNELVRDHALQFHAGRIRGALPTVQQ